jgi:hypothetical protein
MRDEGRYVSGRDAEFGGVVPGSAVSVSVDFNPRVDARGDARASLDALRPRGDARDFFSLSA